MIKKATYLLKNIFGYDSFKYEQEIILNSVLKKIDTLGVVTTGGGKSICYQIPALLFNGLTIVISPLISLMKDQVDSLRILGVEAGFLNSTLNNYEYFDIIKKISTKKIKILYISPERLANESFIKKMQTLDISMIAIDEAHCISQWGHDFRKSYLLIPDFIKKINKRIPLLALTATVTPIVKIDILEKLKMKDPNIYTGSFNRYNIHFKVKKNTESDKFILNYLTSSGEKSGIIYCSTRKEVESLFAYLKLKGFPKIGKYHGGLDYKERAVSQEQFAKDKLNIMIATNAFGMGINKSNIRFIIHSNIPQDIESYYQEAGRAGRDGGEAEAILIYREEDISTQRYLINLNPNTPDEIREIKLKKLESMIGYCESKTCYREYILKYFGEKIIRDFCGNCGNCSKIKTVEDLTTEAKMVISCVGRANQNVGISTLTNILIGRADTKMLNKNLNKLSTFAIMKEKEINWLEQFINYLISEHFLEQSAGSFPVIKLGLKYKTLLKDEIKVLRKIGEKTSFYHFETPVFKALSRLRFIIAEKERVAPYNIFSDLTLLEISEKRPKNRWEMLKIRGIGAHKFNKYGDAFLKVISDN